MNEDVIEARLAYQQAFGTPGPTPFEVDDGLLIATLLTAVKSGQPIPDDFNWYPDLPPGAGT
jgi:hypothetical protein